MAKETPPPPALPAESSCVSDHGGGQVTPLRLECGGGEGHSQQGRHHGGSCWPPLVLCAPSWRLQLVPVALVPGAGEMLFWGWGRRSVRGASWGRKWGGPSCVLPLAHLVRGQRRPPHRKCSQRPPARSPEPGARRGGSGGRVPGPRLRLRIFQKTSAGTSRGPVSDRLLWPMRFIDIGLFDPRSSRGRGL